MVEELRSISNAELYERFQNFGVVARYALCLTKYEAKGR